MPYDKKKKIKEIVAKIPALTNGQIFWLDRVLETFGSPHKYQVHKSDLFDKQILENFGDALRIHHCFSVEPFSKDKFEYVLEQTIRICGHDAELAPKGNRGHDITIDGSLISLKTQADKNIKSEKIWISKFMELGKGQWGDKLGDLIGLRKEFLKHMKNYDRILSLRALEKGPHWSYELIEIPKQLLKESKRGTLEMKFDSKQFPKPGYCHVPANNDEMKFQLYFDGGSERKLQIKNLLKKYCIIHATWDFTIP